MKRRKKKKAVSDGTFLNELLLLQYLTFPQQRAASWQDQDLVWGCVACQYCFSNMSRWICMEVVKVNDCSLTHMLLVSAKGKRWQWNDRNCRRRVGFGEQRMSLCLKCSCWRKYEEGEDVGAASGCGQVSGYWRPAGIQPGSEAEFRRDPVMLKVP